MRWRMAWMEVLARAERWRGWARRWWTHWWREGRVEGWMVAEVRRREAARMPPRSGSVPVGPLAWLGDGPIDDPSRAPNGLTGPVRFPGRLQRPRRGVAAVWGSW